MKTSINLPLALLSRQPRDNSCHQNNLLTCVGSYVTRWSKSSIFIDEDDGMYTYQTVVVLCNETRTATACRLVFNVTGLWVVFRNTTIRSFFYIIMMVGSILLG